MVAVEIGTWSGSWAWGLPLIVLNVIIHVLGLRGIRARMLPRLMAASSRRRHTPHFAAVMVVITTLVTLLHALEASIWAIAYRLLGAIPDLHDAMLYSLSALTTYGHAPIYLENHWRLVGALEALNGVLLFGLTTAFLFAMLQDVSQMDSGS
jgi:amino acid transporter